MEDWNGDSRAPPDVRNLVIRKAVPCQNLFMSRLRGPVILVDHAAAVA